MNVRHRRFHRLGIRALLTVALLSVSATAAAAPLSATKTSDSIVDSNALLFPSNSTWGRAINGEAFQAEALLTHQGYQYTAWYTKDADYSVMIARRTVAGSTVGDWEIVDTGSNLVRGDNSWDVHNTISLGISKNDGTIHMSWDHHGESLRYRVTAAGLATTNTAAWGSGMFGAERSNLNPSGSSTSLPNITYPMFFNTPTGDLQFAYRNGSSGNGEFKLSTYTNGVWNAPKSILGATGTYVDGSYTSTTRNGYPNGFDYGPDGKLHVSWVWRESGGQGANHDINYVYSEDGGAIWKNNAGATVGNTSINDRVLLTDPGIVIEPLDLKQSLYNQQAQAVDINGGVHLLMWHRRQGEPAHAWQSGDPKWDPKDSAYYHYYRDPTSGDWTQRRLPVEVEIDGNLRPLPLGRRPDIGADAQGNVFAVYTTRDPAANPDYVYTSGKLVIAGASATSGYSDWSILHIEEVDFSGEPMIDRQRLFADGVLSIFLQENSPIATVTGTKLRVLEFSVAPPPAVLGDFDFDGDVDGADFVIWQTNFPKASGGTLATGDADSDGDVDGADFVVWQTNFPFTSSPSVNLVSEPSTAGLAFLSMLGLSAIRWGN